MTCVDHPGVALSANPNQRLDSGRHRRLLDWLARPGPAHSQPGSVSPPSTAPARARPCTAPDPLTNKEASLCARRLSAMPFDDREAYAAVLDLQLNPNISRDVRLEDQLMTIWVMYDHVAPNAFLRGPHHQNPCIFEASTERLKSSDRE